MEKLKGKTEQEKFNEKVALSNLKKEKSSMSLGKRSVSSPEMNINFLKKLGYSEKEITKLTGYKIEEGKIKLKDLIKEETVKVTKFIDWNDAIPKLKKGEIIYVDAQTKKDWKNEFHQDFNRKTGSLDIVTFNDRYSGEYLYSQEYVKNQNTVDDFSNDVWYKNKKFKG